MFVTYGQRRKFLLWYIKRDMQPQRLNPSLNPPHVAGNSVFLSWKKEKNGSRIQSAPVWYPDVHSTAWTDRERLLLLWNLSNKSKRKLQEKKLTKDSMQMDRNKVFVWLSKLIIEKFVCHSIMIIIIKVSTVMSKMFLFLMMKGIIIFFCGKTSPISTMNCQ